MYRRTWRCPTWPRIVSSGCLRAGAPRFRATISTIQADASPRRPLPWWSTRYATGDSEQTYGVSERAESGTVIPALLVRLGLAPGSSITAHESQLPFKASWMPAAEEHRHALGRQASEKA